MKRFLLLAWAITWPLTIALAQSYTVTPSASTYSTAGGQLTFTVVLNYPGTPEAVSITARPPGAGWVHVSTVGPNKPDVSPFGRKTTPPTYGGDTINPDDPTKSKWGWAYEEVLAGSASFVFVAEYPAGLSGNQSIALGGDYRANGVLHPVVIGSILLTPLPPLTITQQPAAQTVVTGGNATFTAAATGAASITYRWYFQMSGASAPTALTDVAGKYSGTATGTLAVSNAQATEAGDYVCIASAAGFSDTATNAAPLTVAARLVRVASVTAAPGATVVVPVQLVANGNENAVTFGLQFNPAKLTYVSHATGADLAGGTVTPNVTQKDSGELGFLLGKAPSTVHAAGTRTLLNITFTIATGAVNGELIALSFSETPSARRIFSVDGSQLPGPFVNGSVMIASGLEGDVNGDGEVDGGDWVKLGRIVVGLDAAPTSGVSFLRTDCAPRTVRGDGTIDGGDWVQLGRYVVGLDPLQTTGGPSTPQP